MQIIFQNNLYNQNFEHYYLNMLTYFVIKYLRTMSLANSL